MSYEQEQYIIKKSEECMVKLEREVLLWLF